MVRNLAKSPLAAIFFGTLLYFAGIYIPYTEAYQALAADFIMPPMGNLFYIAYALWISILCALAFSFADKGGLKFIGLLSLAILATSWGIPLVHPALHGESLGVPDLTDTLFTSGFFGVCTILAMVLFMLIYKTHTAPAPSPTDAPKPIITYHLRIIRLIIHIIVLPLVYTVLFFAAWFFLHWRNEEIRLFYGGATENPGFVGAVVNVLLDDAWMLTLELAHGLALTLCALPLLFVYQGKRIMYIVLTIMLFLSGCVWMLIPVPLLPDTIRYSNLIYTAALRLVFGALTAVLFHLCIRKHVEEPPPLPQKRPLTPQQQALLAAKAQKTAENPLNPTAKQAAQVISDTLNSK